MEHTANWRCIHVQETSSNNSGPVNFLKSFERTVNKQISKITS